MSRYERIAGTEDAMILREALEKLSKGSLSSELGDKLDMLITELRQARTERQGELAALVPPPVDVKGLVEKIFSLTNVEKERPSYSFTVKRNSSGILTGIEATPTT